MKNFQFGKWIGFRVVSFGVAALLCFLLDRILQGDNQSYTRFLVSLAGIYVTLAVSLNLINGITGQFSIGHAAFYQIGAYTGAVLAGGMFAKLATSQPLLWLVLAAIFGAITAGISGFIVGLPSLRLRGDYLAVVTLGIGEIVNIIAKNQKALGEAYGLAANKIESVFLVSLLAVICIAVSRNLLKTAHGLAFLAVREDEIASSAMGVNVTKIKVTAFVLGSAFAGAAGALYAHTKGFVSPPDFSMDVSFLILTMVVLGGTGSITGSVLAAVVLFIIPEKMRDLKPVMMGAPIGVAIGIIVGVALLKKIQDNYHGPALKRFGMNVGSIAIGIVMAKLMATLLVKIPALQHMINGASFRMPALAVTLVVLMLLRPQGVFAHHEFSWSWVQKLLGRKSVPETEVAA
ncbi:MAG: branched-chain amino acid ABC transporter permease [Armatimonadetes bacterium]|nr:branched-chain amino acid ABC transporter permease [Armatimonadota bacterium]MBS1725765.1 branched-chain amino acid ABC transporter permease [Armatimonadota bacterium]